ncbi:hypothetical protein Fcan01_25586 [Folsomia candida]|uniref:Uncharacterized protein n=1 Tax=Folsomia candida TaxID=158441 RepID=A0A226D6C1_FOLCA|nr:hypothetical protein Fcan01_25586 [Folsomia candida]
MQSGFAVLVLSGPDPEYSGADQVTVFLFHCDWTICCCRKWPDSPHFDEETFIFHPFCLFEGHILSIRERLRTTMELLRQARGPTRGSITKTVNDMEAELANEKPDRHKLGVQIKKLDNLQVKMAEWDSKILAEMQLQGCTDEEYTQASTDIEI